MQFAAHLWTFAGRFVLRSRQGVPRLRSIARALGCLACLCLLYVVPVAAQPAVVGQWNGPYSWPFAVSHAVLLGNGRVLVWNDLGELPQIWNPSTALFASAAAPDTLPAGVAQVITKEGRVLFLGGRSETDSGLTTVLRFDVAGNSWATLTALNAGRAAAAAVLLGDGRVLALAGDVSPGFAAAFPELGQPGSNWIILSDASRSLPLRPWSFQLSTGAVAVAGPDRTTRVLDVSVPGDWTLVDDMLLGPRDGGTAVLVPGSTDRILILGGRSPATSTCEILDLATTLSWRSTASMSAARRHHNATLLADGTVLVTGGTLIGDESQYTVRAAEVFDPAMETWTDLDSMNVSRRQNSVALLLPDARVLIGGGGTGASGSELHADAEIYSPPYLFRGQRPVITTAPDSVGYGDSLVVATPDDSIAAVWWVRAGSTSGGWNADQRALDLGFARSSGQIKAASPSSPNAAPPGPYLMFLVHQSGAPSLGRFVRLYAAPAPEDLPVIGSTPSGAASVGAQYVYAATATGPGPITWSLTQAPSWLTVNDLNGVVFGIPTAEQTFNVTLRATNAMGFVEQAWSITAGGTARKIVPIGAIWRYFKGTTNPGSTWANLGFIDSAWLTGASGFGFGDLDDATILADMQGIYSTVYTRHTFTLHEVQSVTRIAVLYDYDDGFAVYLNGTRIFDQRAPVTITNTSVSTSSHEATHVFVRQEITTPSILALLQEGPNVLAAVGLNTALTSNDLTLRIEFEVTGGADFPVDVATADIGHGDTVFPNPFVRETQFRFALQNAGDARLEVFDVRGRRIRTVLAARLAAGRHVVAWDGRDAHGDGVAPGFYFYRLVTPGQVQRGKLVRSGS